MLKYHENNSHLSSEYKADKENTSDVSACKTKTKSLPSQFNEQMSQYILKNQQLTHPSPSQPKDGDEMDNQVVFGRSTDEACQMRSTGIQE